MLTPPRHAVLRPRRALAPRQLAAAIPTREVARTIEERDELWDAPLLYGLVVAGLTAEWILRKRFRLV